MRSFAEVVFPCCRVVGVGVTGAGRLLSIGGWCWDGDTSAGQVSGA